MTVRNVIAPDDEIGENGREEQADLLTDSIERAAVLAALNHKTMLVPGIHSTVISIEKAVNAIRALPPSPDSGEVVADMFWPTDDYETCLDDPADYADQSGEEALVFEVACAKKLPNEFVAARYVEKEGWIVSYHDTEAEADKALAGPKP